VKLNEEKNDRPVDKYKLFIHSFKLENEFWNNLEQCRTTIYEIRFVLFLVFHDNIDHHRKRNTRKIHSKQFFEEMSMKILEYK